VAVSSSVNFSSAVAAMTAGFIASSDPQMFATAVTSSLSAAIPADFSSVVVVSLIFGDVPGASGVLNFTNLSTSRGSVLSAPAPAPTADGGLRPELIAVIAISAISVFFMIGGLVWWKLKSSSVAAVWPEEKYETAKAAAVVANETAAVKLAPALDAVVDTSSSFTQSSNVLDYPRKVQPIVKPH
jgi:hypothetical protein